MMLPPPPRRPSIGKPTTFSKSAPASPGDARHVEVGARVEARFKGEWYGALITELVSDRQFAQVLFDDGVQDTISVGLIRPARLSEGVPVELRLGHDRWLDGQVRRLASRRGQQPECAR